MIPTISATALSRRYRDQIALDEVSLTVEPGTVTGLLGRNGAGKTTLMRIITGLEFPTAGDLRVFGEVDGSTAPGLQRALDEARRTASPHTGPAGAQVVCDLSEIGFLGAAGLSVLIAAATADGMELRIVTGQRLVRRVLTLAGLDGDLDTVDQLVDALTTARSPRRQDP